MSTYSVLDGNGSLKYVYGMGSGASGDPYRLASDDYTDTLYESGKLFIHNDRHSVANNATLYYLIKTPASPSVTLCEVSIATTASPINFDLYEDAIVSANGTNDNAFNANRIIGTAPATQMYNTPTVTSTGNSLLSDTVNGDKTVGGSNVNEFKIRLKPSANYLIGMVNSSGGVAVVVPCIKFTET